MCVLKLTHHLWMTQFSQILHLALELKYDHQSTI